MLQQREMDVTMTVMEKKIPSGTHSKVLPELPLVFLVPGGSPLPSAEELWR